MGYYEQLLEIAKIKKAMLDEESRLLFDAKIDYMISRDADRFYDVSDTLGKKWRCKELDEILKKISVKGIIIFGSGHDGRRTKRILEICNYSPDYFCDSDTAKAGTCVEGLEVLAVDSLSLQYHDYLVILGSAKYAEEMQQSLLSEDFPTENILNPQYGILTAEWGNQYFDVFPAEKEEVFVDGGGYDGDTTLSFITWTEGTYNKIYVFEPIAEMSRFIENRIEKEQIDRIKVYGNALWDRRETLYFQNSGSGSHMSETGKIVVKGTSLDEEIGEEKVTFIKMDVEGSERKALMGAKGIIKKNKPKLAICIYHNPEDILEIPTYILELVPEYRFYIRHYTSCMWETVLYAEIP